MTEPFPRLDREVPAITATQMADVDRVAVDEFEIILLQMMENAGSALARLSAMFVPRDRTVLVLAGGGGNGGGALTAARRLLGFGFRVEIQLDRAASSLSPAAAHQLAILHAAGISESETARFPVVPSR